LWGGQRKACTTEDLAPKTTGGGNRSGLFLLKNFCFGSGRIPEDVIHGLHQNVFIDEMTVSYYENAVLV